MEKRNFDVDLSMVAKCDYRKNHDGRCIFPCIQDLLNFLDRFDTSECFFRGQSGLWDVTF